MYSVKNTNYSSSCYSENSRNNTRKKSAQAMQKEKTNAAAGERGEAEGNAGGVKSPEEEKSENKGFSNEEAAVLTLESLQEKKKEEEEEETQGLVSKLLGQAEAMKQSFEEQRENQTNLYDATMDLMAIASAERETVLKAIQVRLMFKIRTIKASGAKSGEVQIAVNKLKKVIGKLKTKIKKLKEEAGIEKKRKNAEKAKKRKLEERLRRELEVRRTIRKNREKKDVEESRMGMGANYGGVAGSEPAAIKDFGLAGFSGDAALENLITSDLELGMGVDSAAAAYAIAGAPAGMDGGAAAGGAVGDACAVSIDISV